MNKKVLIVDDDARNLRILQEILEDDYDLEMAENGEIALEKVHSYQPNIVLLDIMMPGISGLEVCKSIRQNPQLNNITIVLISGRAFSHEKQKANDVGANAYITKPFDEDELLATLNKFTEQ